MLGWSGALTLVIPILTTPGGLGGGGTLGASQWDCMMLMCNGNFCCYKIEVSGGALELFVLVHLNHHTSSTSHSFINCFCAFLLGAALGLLDGRWGGGDTALCCCDSC